MKYFVGRKSKITGQVDYQYAKCRDLYCSEKYIRTYPKRVWQFSKQGAKGIVDRENGIASMHGWNYEYFMIPVTDILPESEVRE